MLVMENGGFNAPAISLRGLNWMEEGAFNESCSGEGFRRQAMDQNNPV